MVVASQAEGGDDDVRYSVGLVKDLDRSSEGLEVSDGCVREKSVIYISVYQFHAYKYNSLGLELVGKDEIGLAK